MIGNSINNAKSAINHLFVDKEPWQIVSITTIAVLSTVSVYNFLNGDEDLIKRSKKTLFRLVRKLPFIQQKIDTELEGTNAMFEQDVIKRLHNVPFITELPSKGLSDDEIIKLVARLVKLGEFEWENGKVSGAVYKNDAELLNLISEVYKITSYTNPLHVDIFPGVCKMEAEIIRMACRLFNGDDNTCGSVSTGGTESILLACKAFRDYAKDVKGIQKPEMVVPVTAHSAFDKAAQYLNIRIRSVPVDPVHYQADVNAMKKAINSNTILLVGSTPNFPYGTMDDIEAISELGLKYNIPVHVDACLGGFLICFMEKAGYKPPTFDFRLPGVSSISADTHKYGYAPKGSSIILYKSKKYRHYQFTITTDWPGGIYGSPTVSGSRAGGIIATCWSTMMHFGLNGYVEATKKIIETTRQIEKGLRKINGIYLFGTPATSVIALGSHDFNIYRLTEALTKKGWNLSLLQFPSGVHLCVTHIHTLPGVADQFVNDVQSVVDEIMLNPDVPTNGMLAMYGSSQSLGDRTIVGDFVRQFLDSMYYIPKLEN